MLKSNCIPKYFNLETVKLILVSTHISSSDKESNRATCFDLSLIIFRLLMLENILQETALSTEVLLVCSTFKRIKIQYLILCCLPQCVVKD
jgi:hypothetical protein